MRGGGAICMGSNEKLLAKTFTSDDNGYFRNNLKGTPSTERCTLDLNASGST